MASASQHTRGSARRRGGALLGTALLLAATPTALAAQTVVSAFAGSEEIATYESDFDVLAYATELAMKPDIKQVEGRMVSRVYGKPASTSNVEIFRSYRRELEAKGFTVHLAAEPGNTTGWMVKQLFDPPNTVSFHDRPWLDPGGQRARGLELQFITGLADYYLVASREQGGRQHWVSVVLSKQRPRYLIEELTPAPMEKGTVTLNLDAMKAAIDETGKIAVYDIHFASGSAVIEPRSSQALAVIADYLGQAPGAYYIVGHTDDMGSLESNLTLSNERAAAVRDALVAEHRVDAGSLETRGVGPLAPVSNNTDEAGRALNRRVEIVQRLP